MRLYWRENDQKRPGIIFTKNPLGTTMWVIYHHKTKTILHFLTISQEHGNCSQYKSFHLAMSFGHLSIKILTGAALLFCFANLGIGTWFFFNSLADATSRKVQSRDFDSNLTRQTSSEMTQRQAKKNLSAVVAEVQINDINLEPIPRPPLRSIVQGWNITGDPSWLLQFSIVGFPKSGTSTLMFHLRSHPEIHIFKDERCELAYNQHVRLIEALYRNFPPSNASHRFVRGIKCPQDLENTKLSMRNYKKVFPKADFIVGIRHPVLWYESSTFVRNFNFVHHRI